jgi:hypothetical protein
MVGLAVTGRRRQRAAVAGEASGRRWQLEAKITLYLTVLTGRRKSSIIFNGFCWLFSTANLKLSKFI